LVLSAAEKMKAGFHLKRLAQNGFVTQSGAVKKQRWSVIFSGGTFPVFSRLAEISQCWSWKALRIWI